MAQRSFNKSGICAVFPSGRCSLLLICMFLMSYTQAALPDTREMSETGIGLIQHSCGQVVNTFTKEEIKAKLEGYANDLSGVIGDYFRYAIAPNINYGVQSIKICASCTMFQGTEMEASGEGTYEDYCDSDSYGNDALVSGLLLLPLANDPGSGIDIPKGPLKGTFFTHGTESQSFEVPSEFDLRYYNSYLPAVIPVTLGAVTVLPDYLGYGESHEYYKSYLIKRAYQTSAIPLWLEAKRIVSSVSKCESELVDIAAVNGYSEGGYSAVAIAAALSDLGVRVLGTYAGGGPYRLSSALLVEGTRLFDEGLYPYSGWYYLALFSSSYSSTNPDVANFDKGQDFAADEYLSSTDSSKNVVTWVNDGLPSWKINSLIPSDDPLSIVNENFVEVLRRAVTENNMYPCVSSDTSHVGVIDKLCEALVNNDLTATLETAQHPIHLCHSPDDYMVPIQNLPNISANPFLNYDAAFGDHGDAVVWCILSYIDFLTSEEFMEVPTELSGSCELPSDCISLSTECALLIPASDASKACRADAKGDSAKPKQVIFRYIQEPCENSNTTQAKKKWSCKDEDGVILPTEVKVVVYDKKGNVLLQRNVEAVEGKDTFKVTVQEEGKVSLGSGKRSKSGSGKRSKSGSGKRSKKKIYGFGSDILIDILTQDESDLLLQSVSIHTSCSTPLNPYDTFGAIQLLEARSDIINSLIDCSSIPLSIANVGAADIQLKYTLTNPHPSAVLLNELRRAMYQPSAGIVNKTKIVLSSAILDGETTETITEIIKLELRRGGDVTIDVEVDTSPQNDCTVSDEIYFRLPSSGVSAARCDKSTKERKPMDITLQYIGGSCDDSQNEQGRRASCSGKPVSGNRPVDIVATDKKVKRTFFRGSVPPGGTFVVDSRSKNLGSEVRLTVSLDGQAVEVKFHTSCSVPLNVGDAFGPIKVVGWTMTNGEIIGGASPSLPGCN